MNNKKNVEANFYSLTSSRRKAKQRHYMRQGISKIFTRPLIGVLFTMMIIIAFVIAWKAGDVYIMPLIKVSVLVPLVDCAYHIFVPIMLLLMSAGILWLLGAPPKWREIDDNVAAVFGLSTKRGHTYKCPFLISIKKIKGSSVSEYVFWSRWVDLDKWNKPDNKKAIFWALDAHSDEDFTYGKGKYTVTIRAGSGVEPEERQAPNDPLF